MTRRPPRRDLYEKEFAEACAELAEAVAQFQPDLLVGIETGGARVAEAMVDALGCPRLVGVRVQRPATKLKSRMDLGRVFGRLPRGAVDLLRWAEVEMREALLRIQEAPARSAAANSLLATSGLRDAATDVRRILVVDDTIDSGRTLSVVKRAVELANPAADIRTAVLASTWRRPPVQPDYCLYGRCLLRLPWSFDAQRL